MNMISAAAVIFYCDNPDCGVDCVGGEYRIKRDHCDGSKNCDVLMVVFTVIIVMVVTGITVIIVMTSQCGHCAVITVRSEL
jgi:hypothetical protein